MNDGENVSFNKFGTFILTVLYPLFCTFRNRKTYKIRGTLQNKGYVSLILYKIRGTLVCIQDLKGQKAVIVLK